MTEPLAWYRCQARRNATQQLQLHDNGPQPLPRYRFSPRACPQNQPTLCHHCQTRRTHDTAVSTSLKYACPP
uniref:Uncharacterized protein n=1 Tax=Arundo donax TaxID=35708 RepID=A0A0A9B9C6_ARUDO